MEPLDRPTTGFLMWRVSTKWRTAVDRALKPVGLTHAQFALLAVLSGLSRSGARPRQRAPAETTGVEAIYVSKLARALEKNGLVERPADPDDPRAVRLGLTAKGRAAIIEALQIVHALHEELTRPIGGLDGEENRRLRDTLLTLLGDYPFPETTGGEAMTTTERTLDGRDLNLAAAAAKSLLTAVLDREGLTFGQYIVLRTAVLGSAATAEELLTSSAGPAVGSVADLRPALGVLAERGLLAGPEPTAAGRELIDRVATDSRAAGDRLFEGFTPEELATTKRVLNMVTERASEVRDAL